MKKKDLTLFLSRLLVIVSILLHNNVTAQCVTTYPYSEGFEAAPSWTPGGTNSDWAWGTPSHPTINSAGGGNKSWCVGGLTGTFYAYSLQSTLTSPCFDFTNLSYPWISFKIFWECERQWDGMQLQYSTNGGTTWTRLGAFGDPVDCNTDNWYNYNNVNYLNSLPAGTRHGWSGRLGATAGSCSGGSGSAGWVTAQHCLSGLANQPNVKFRFLMGSGSACNSFDGVAIDDIYISNGVSHSPNYSVTCLGNGSLNFTAVIPSCPAVSSYTWNFGDPASGTFNTSSLANPNHIFSSTGIYSVSLVTAGGGCNPPGIITQTLNVANFASQVTTNSITCFGMSNGSSTVIPNGSGPYTYTWLPSGGNSATASNLSPGTYSVEIEDGNNCVDTKTVTIVQPSPLTTTIASSNSSCGSASGSATVTVSGGSMNYAYSWSPVVNTSSVLSSVSAGTYSVSITDANNCTTSATVNVTQPPSITATTSDYSVCSGSSLAITANASGGKAPYTFIWNGGALTGQTINVNPVADIQYSLLVTDDNGCTSLPAVSNVYVSSQPTVIINQSETICLGSVTSLSANVIGATNVNYLWNPGSYTTSAITIAPTTNATYSVNIIASGPCPLNSQKQVTVMVLPKPVITTTNSSVKGCAPLCVSFKDMSSTASGSISAMNWTFSNGQSSIQSDPIICFKAPGTYSGDHVVTNSYGCSSVAKDFVNITVYPQPVADFNHAPVNPVVNVDNDVVFSDASYGAEIVSWNWFFMNTPQFTSNLKNPSFVYSDAGTYVVALVVKSDKGCADTLLKPVTVSEDYGLFMPNAFSPNNDGLNDFFQTKGHGISKYELFIFDRWGELLYQNNNIEEGWDGNYKGHICSDGVYTWLIKVTDTLGKVHELKGHVTLFK